MRHGRITQPNPENRFYERLKRGHGLVAPGHDPLHGEVAALAVVGLVRCQEPLRLRVPFS